MKANGGQMMDCYCTACHSVLACTSSDGLMTSPAGFKEA